MSLRIRMTLILMIALAISAGLVAQEAQSPAAESTQTGPTTTEVSEVTTEAGPEEATATEEDETVQPSYEIRRQFSTLLRQSPNELPQLLLLDPSLMSNDEFLLGWPTLSRFLEAHPEVLRNPRYYLAEFEIPARSSSLLDEAFEMLGIVATFALVAFALGWFIRTVIEQKRWNRLFRTQTEVHNKILDRFGSTEELLTYIKTPAGSKFLEAAPIPLHTERATQNPPMPRVVWSIQIGVILAATAVGMLLVSLRLEADAARELFSLGVIAFFVGAGFIASAGVSIYLSRRLGLWQDPSSASIPPTNPLNDSGPMR